MVKKCKEKKLHNKNNKLGKSQQLFSFWWNWVYNLMVHQSPYSTIRAQQPDSMGKSSCLSALVKLTVKRQRNEAKERP